MPPRARGLATRAQMGRAAAAAFAVALAGGGVMGWLSLVNFLTALALGFVVGSAAFIASQRHRDAAIQGLAGGAALVGIVFAAVLGTLFVWGSATDPARAILAISFAEYVLPAIAAMAGAILRFML